MKEPRIEILKRFGEKEVVISHVQMLRKEAELVAAFIERWGMVAGQPDGEDTAGRHKLRLSTPEELVTRAFEIAEVFFAEAEKRGYVLDLPQIERTAA